MLKYLPYIKHFFIKNFPVEITFLVTSRCNARCSHCFYHRDINVKKDELSLEEIKKIFSDFGPLLRVSISGGEPFIREDIVELTRLIYNYSKPPHITIPTNGILTDRIINSVKGILDYCRAATINVGISLDGLGEQRDKIMGVEGSFDKSMDTYFRLKESKKSFRNFILGVVLTQTYSNQRDIEKIYEFAKDELKPDNIAFSLVRGSSRDEEEMNIDINIFKKMVEKIKKDNFQGRFPFWKIFAWQRNVVYHYVAEAYEKNKYLLPCYSGRIRIILTPEGDVYPCEILMLKDRDRFKLGNLRDCDYKIRKIYNSDRYREINNFIKDSRCFCRHECDLTTNFFFNPHLLLKQYLHQL
jgi:radical SAM protein with 4Fe4S-binding SPASM domain